MRLLNQLISDTTAIPSEYGVSIVVQWDDLTTESVPVTYEHVGQLAAKLTKIAKAYEEHVNKGS